MRTAPWTQHLTSTGVIPKSFLGHDFKHCLPPVQMQISGTFEAGCLSNTHACVLRSRIRETGYRGNAVSSSVKNSVGERRRIERDTEK